MGAEEIIVIAIAVVFVLSVTAHQIALKIKAKKSGKPLGCGGCCSSCRGCSCKVERIDGAKNMEN